eukprot:NODE_6939_length_613_cov_170.065844_g6916_i0.p2 GENE.NODE_6939_length_613_cov_170.065844_g6916_i0~~NODE_6939_length_613_cov_170.065844_g6916_i0.p2  ORF type:complete len:151 (+),score=21.99 NODE_6939_length_613_cov_170.065844_g6916_i0:55-507(+)
MALWSLSLLAFVAVCTGLGERNYNGQGMTGGFALPNFPSGYNVELFPTEENVVLKQKTMGTMSLGGTFEVYSVVSLGPDVKGFAEGEMVVVKTADAATCTQINRNTLSQVGGNARGGSEGTNYCIVDQDKIAAKVNAAQGAYFVSRKFAA